MLDGVDNSVIIDNRFLGDGFAAIVSGYDFLGRMIPAIDNAVLANNFAGFAGALGDVFLASQSVRGLVGPGQGANVVDEGTDSIITDNILIEAALQPQTALRVLD